MKKIGVLYDETGFIKKLTDDSAHYEQENGSLVIEATITTDKKVRAYLRSANKNSCVTDEIIPVDNVYSYTAEADCMSKGTLTVGFEIYDDEGYIERLEPLKIYIDSFVELGGGDSDNVYVVTVKVGDVVTLGPDENAYVQNTGTKKDMTLNFGIPKGDKGDKGDKGSDGYTPVKGVDYFTPEDVASLGIDNKVDKIDGKGLSTNDFTDYLKNKLINIKGIETISINCHPKNIQDYTAFKESFSEIINSLSYGIYKISYFSQDESRIYQSILLVTGENLDAVNYSSIYRYTYFDYEDNRWYELIANYELETINQDWKCVSVIPEDLSDYVTTTAFNSAIGDIENALDSIINMQNSMIGGDA